MSKKTTCSCHRWSGGWMSKTAYKRRHMESSSISTRLYVNKTGITQCPHCQSSFCPPLKISFPSRFLLLTTFHLWWSRFPRPAWQHFIGTSPTSFWAHVAYQQYHVFIFLPNWMQLLMRCQGHLNGGETGQQGDVDFRLHNTSNVRTSTPVLKMTRLPHLSRISQRNISVG